MLSYRPRYAYSHIYFDPDLDLTPSLITETSTVGSVLVQVLLIFFDPRVTQSHVKKQRVDEIVV